MSLTISQNTPLKNYTTLGIGGEAEYFVEVYTEAELIEAVAYAQVHHLRITVLGGGSNVLISDQGVTGLVILMSSTGIGATESESDSDSVLVTAQGGESLDAVVLYSVEQGLWGIENLSHIPGTVGATPIQNVGAYGVEVKDVIAFVTVLNTETNEVEKLQNEFCNFGYRDSLFKKENGKIYIIISVTFFLSKNANLKIAYRDLKNRFENKIPSLREIREAVIEIRSHKFPNWKEVGTAGSFFKNPSVTEEKFQELLTRYPELQGYVNYDGSVKLSLGWILDKVLHLKGYKEGNVATYSEQALVLVVEKNATATEVISFAEKIIEKVKNEIDVTIECEVTMMK